MSRPAQPIVLAWTALVRAHAAALGRIQAALKAAGMPPLEWYDVLLELERGGPMRPRDLQLKLLLAQYNLSRLLDRMSDAGLIARERCEADGRGQLVGISDTGRSMREQMWGVYGPAIENAVGQKLSTQDATALAKLLARLSA